MSRAAPEACGLESRVQQVARVARDPDGNCGADAAESEAALRAHALVPPGPRHYRDAAGFEPVSLERTARSRTARVSPERRHRRAARPADLPEAVECARHGQGRARRTRADLGTREDAAPSRRIVELKFAQTTKSTKTPAAFFVCFVNFVVYKSRGLRDVQDR